MTAINFLSCVHCMTEGGIEKPDPEDPTIFVRPPFATTVYNGNALCSEHFLRAVRQ